MSTINNGNKISLEVDRDGCLKIPSEVASRYGICPGTRVNAEELNSGIYLQRPVTQLAKLYIEPTNKCNLSCRTCIGNTWNETPGFMNEEVFNLAIEGLKRFSPVPRVFFGGIGEPLLHPKIGHMVSRAKEIGAAVEIITNGTLLEPALLKELLSAGLDMLWVSIDGAKPESYADVRLGAQLPRVLENLGYFKKVKSRKRWIFSGDLRTQLGIVFVAMKRNIAELPAVCQIAWRLGASRFMITNVLPYTVELKDEMLYCHEMDKIHVIDPELAGWQRSFLSPHIYVPRIEMDGGCGDAVRSIVSGEAKFTWADSIFRSNQNRCPFIDSGTGALRWDGNLSPCLPLLHNSVIYFNDRERYLKSYSIGNITKKGLVELWNLPEHIAFRERVQRFEFAPCSICGGCSLLESNEEDCLKSGFPACGGCLWAQGVIQCP